MDYKKILIQYIAYVCVMEGTHFISPYMDISSLTAEENIALVECKDIAEKDYL